MDRIWQKKYNKICIGQQNLLLCEANQSLDASYNPWDLSLDA